MRKRLIPKIFHNCETWTNVKKKLITELDKGQYFFVERLLELPDSTPKIGSLYESGIIPAEKKLDGKNYILPDYLQRKTKQLQE